MRKSKGAVTGVGAITLIIAVSIVTAVPAEAGVAEVLEKVIEYINGKVARSLAILAVMLLGIGWWFGSVDWKRAGGIIFGIGIVFGAAEIADLIKG